MENEGTADRRGAASPQLDELARLADELVAEIGDARRHYDELRTAIDGVDGVASADGAVEAEDTDVGAGDGAQLIALSVALGGGTPEDARDELRKQFGIVDANEIVDDAFGALAPDGRTADRARRRRFSRRAR